jgi:hypothetical protein
MEHRMPINRTLEVLIAVLVAAAVAAVILAVLWPELVGEVRP